MTPPGPADGWTVQNLREQVRHLETLLLHQRLALLECRKNQETFATAAAERLTVIERGDALLRERDLAIEQARQDMAAVLEDVAQLQSTLSAQEAAHEKERAKWELARREALRGMEELVRRERELTRENVVLRNRGLIHSIIDRMSRIFS